MSHRICIRSTFRPNVVEVQMKMVKGLLLKPNVFGGKRRSGPKFGPGGGTGGLDGTGIIEGSGLCIEGAGFGLDGGTVL